MTSFRFAFALALIAVSLPVAAQDSSDSAAASPKKEASPPSAAVSNDPRIRGAHAFAENGCPQCHTIRHSGGTKGPDLSGVGRRLTEEQIRTQIVNGGKQMPPFGSVLQLTEADDLVAYLHSLRDKEKKSK
jgi:mono/diheme cytochrome c family protein